MEHVELLVKINQFMQKIQGELFECPSRIVSILGDPFWGKSYLLKSMFDYCSADVAIFQNSTKVENYSQLLDNLLIEICSIKRSSLEFKSISIFLDEFYYEPLFKELSGLLNDFDYKVYLAVNQTNIPILYNNYKGINIVKEYKKVIEKHFLDVYNLNIFKEFPELALFEFVQIDKMLRKGIQLADINVNKIFEDKVKTAKIKYSAKSNTVIKTKKFIVLRTIKFE